MLGRRIADPTTLNRRAKTLEGWGSSPWRRCLKRKNPDQTGRVHLRSGLAVHGYEIHHGQSRGEIAPVLRLGQNEEEAGGGSGRLWGSYLHGIFDADPFRRWFIDSLRARRGLAARTGFAPTTGPALTGWRQR